MADNTSNEAARDRLQVVLGAYGADPARWPQADRHLAPLLAADPALTAPLEDARALDSALARASRPLAPTGAAERLVAAALSPPGNVVAFEQPGHIRRAALPGRLAALTAMAASLAFGLYLGASGQGDWLTPPLLADDSGEYLSAELDVLDATMELFEDHMEP